MTKIDIFSGFLGAGKTTLIKKLIEEVYTGEKLVLIENEFGEIGIDGGFLQDAGINITEMNSGCICCSLVGDFGEALKKVMEQFSPDRILIEPSGVGKLSDVIKAVQNLGIDDIQLNSFTTVVDATKCKMYMKNFGEFFNNQVEYANSVILSRTDGMKEDKIDAVVKMLREHNTKATIIATPWDKISGQQILETMEHKNTLQAELERLAKEQEKEACPVCGGHHHHHDHDHEHGECHHHDHDHEHGECHHHDHDHEHGECHHHDHDHEHGECCHHDHDHEYGECHHHDHEHHHEHEHDHDGHCCCGHDHDHDHHHHHHADEVFTSWGAETTAKYSIGEIEEILRKLSDEKKYGVILRSKGIVDSADGQWVHFDYVPNEVDVRHGSAAVIGRLCVIGSKINEEALKELFHI